MNDVQDRAREKKEKEEGEVLSLIKTCGYYGLSTLDAWLTTLIDELG